MDAPVIPDHLLLRRIGRGAYGEVWLARNVMGSPRAVKVLWRRDFESARPFEREFLGIQRYEPVSRSSGGLVHVLHVGRNDREGYFYYVMELADDSMATPGLRPGSDHEPLAAGKEPGAYQPRTLRSDLRRLGRLPTAECLRVAIDVASGLGQLHRHGLVHRDVKPGNIIYVNSRAKLADIGLVTAEGEGRTFVGTEGYIPPEGPGTPAADLYALGIVLYEASTGFPPERLPDVPQEWFTAAEGDQALELHEIILKACEGQRERRYANADALQADLALLQSGQSVRHARALQRRYARLRMSGAVGTTLLVIAVATALFANYRARLAAQSRAKEARLRQQAQQAQALAENAEQESRRQLQSALYEEARALVLSKELGHRARALEAIGRAAGSTNVAELRRVAFAALGLPDFQLEHELAMPTGATFAAMDPAFERIAVGSGSESVSIRSVPDLRLLATLAPSTNNETYGSLWSRDGRFLAVKRQYDPSGNRCDVEAWNIARAQRVFTAGGDISSESFCFHPSRPLLMVGHVGGAVSLWNLETGQESPAFQLPDTPQGLSYSPDGRRVAASYVHGSNSVLAFHDSSTGTKLSACLCEEPVQFIAWAPDGQSVSFTGDTVDEWNRGVWLASSHTGELSLLGRHKIKTAGISFSPDGNYLMSCGWERELYCWDLRTRQRVFTFADAGYALDWSQDGTRCATVMRRRGEFHMEVYRFQRPACLELTGNRGERLRSGAFSPDGRWLALADSRNVCVWNLQAKAGPALLPPLEDPFAPFFSPDGTQLFTISGQMGAAKLSGWRLPAARESGRPPELTPLTMTLPPRLGWAGVVGSDLAITSEEGVRFLSLTNLNTADCRIVRIPLGLGTVSPDGRWLAVIYSYSPMVTVYRLPQVEAVKQLQTGQLVASVWFSPHSEELTVINRGGLEQWDTATWRLRHHEPGWPVSYSYVLYAPDGKTLWRVTNLRDTALCVRKTLEPLLPLPANIVPLALSTDGRQLAVSVDDQRVQVWELAELRSHLRELGLDWADQ